LARKPQPAGWDPINLNMSLIMAARGSSPDIDHVDLCVKLGAEIERAVEGKNALHWAASAGHVDVVRRLLELGADIEGKTPGGYSALFLAAGFNRLDVAKVLLKEGASLDTRSDNGDTPLHNAAKYAHSDVIELFLRYDADLEARNLSGRTPLLCAFDLITKQDIATTYIHLIELLLEKGAKPDARDNEEKTLLHLVVDLESEDMACQVTQQLLERGVSVDVRDKTNSTALHLAAAKGKEKLAALLLEQGAYHKSKNSHNKTPLQLAAENGHTKLADALIEKVSDIKRAVRQQLHGLTVLVRQQGEVMLQQGRTLQHQAKIIASLQQELKQICDL